MAVTLRLLDAGAVIAAHATRSEDLTVLRRQAEMIRRGRTVLSEVEDQAAVECAFQATLVVLKREVVDVTR